MTTDVAETLATVVNATGEDWMLSGDNALVATSAVASSIETAEAVYRQIIAPGSSVVPPLSIPNVIAEHQRNPQRIKALLQAIGARFSPAFVALVWRLVNGDLIETVQMNYRGEDGGFAMTVEAREPDTDTLRSFSTHEIRDSRLFRHLSITETNGIARFSSFLALRR
jgi:hypothetical protein